MKFLAYFKTNANNATLYVPIFTTIIFFFKEKRGIIAAY
jgi:hypothetical protein